MMYKTVSYYLYQRLNQNPEGFQYGETQKEVAFCQGSNQSASSLVNCAAPILIIIRRTKEAHVPSLESVFHCISHLDLSRYL